VTEQEFFAQFPAACLEPGSPDPTDELKDRIRKLENRVEELEQALADVRQFVGRD
jgi:hypothetical protein